MRNADKFGLKFLCQNCGGQFYSLNKPAPLPCPKCKWVCGLNHIFDEAEREAAIERFRNHCDVASTTRADILPYLMTKTAVLLPGDRLFVCPTCGRRFPSQNECDSICFGCGKSVPLPDTPKVPYPKRAQLQDPATEKTESKGSAMELIQKKDRYGAWTSKLKDTDILHCEDGPASKDAHSEEWYWMGQQHRVGGPAYKNEQHEVHYFMGMEHNLDGPASRRKNYYNSRWSETYYVFGEHYSKAKWKKLQADKAMMKQLREAEAAMMPRSLNVKLADPEKPKGSKESGSFLPVLAAAGALGAAGLFFAKAKMPAVAVAEKATAATV